MQPTRRRPQLDQESHRFSPQTQAKSPKRQLWNTLHLLLTVLLLFTTVYQFSTRTNSQPPEAAPIAVDTSTHEAIASDLEDSKSNLETLKQTVAASQQQIHKLRHAVEVANQQAQEAKGSAANDQKEQHARDHALEQRSARMENALKTLSTSLLRLEFGEADTYFVELTLGFPESMGEPQEERVVVETAPVSVVPHAIYYWLKQIDLGLWDGCSFFRNAGHVLQASSRSKDGKGLWSRFKHLSELPESISFQEYSDKFQHEKYTLGLAGRPGGPDFYISTVNNVKNHGPGGQQSYQLKAEADSCFAKVITQDGGRSIEVVKRMQTSKRKPGGFREMVDYIEIKSAKILRDHSYQSETSG